MIYLQWLITVKCQKLNKRNRRLASGCLPNWYEKKKKQKTLAEKRSCVQIISWVAFVCVYIYIYVKSLCIPIAVASGGRVPHWESAMDNGRQKVNPTFNSSSHLRREIVKKVMYRERCGKMGTLRIEMLVKNKLLFKNVHKFI